jgi:hypothetical protein
VNHAITIGGLLLSIGAVGGLACIGIGALMLFAGGMSDAGDDGTATSGCAIAVAGVCVAAFCIAGLVL